MSGGFRYRILLADHEDASLAATAAALSREGYVVLTAHDGFEALAELRGSVPEIVVSELTMPNMSGFELLGVIRQRFPGVGVIAQSRDFYPLGVPEGVLADIFLQKSENFDFELIEAIRELLSRLPLRTSHAREEIAPVWIPRNNTNYVVITCPHCLRSSSLRRRDVAVGSLQTSSCLHCGQTVSYRMDATHAEDMAQGRADGLAPTVAEMTRRAIAESKKSIAESKKLMRGRTSG